MRKNLIFSIAVTALIGCDPGYSVFIKNNSSAPLFVKVQPSIESFYDSVHSSFYKSIVAHRVAIEDEFSVYKIAPNENFLAWSHIGIKPYVTEVPFNYISFNNMGDSMVLDSKQKIIESLKEDKKRRNYYIEVVK